MKMTVIGAGAWGSALASVLCQKHREVFLWAREEEVVKSINEVKQNTLFLPDISLPENLKATGDLTEAASDADVIVMVTPSHVVREIVIKIKSYVKPGAIVVSAAKGLEIGSLKRLTEIIAEEIPAAQENIAALSGPNHADEVARCEPSATVVAAKSRKCAEFVQDLFMAPYFRVYINPDVIGVELGGVLKNIIALGVGIADGMNVGANAKAAFMTRGAAEISRLGVAMGARPLTFAGLSGIGDLIVTCTSRNSRNWRAGTLLAAGKSVEEIQSATNMVVEGIKSTMAAYELARRYKVSMPITEKMYQVLYQGLNPNDAVIELMTRLKTYEEVAKIDDWE